MSAWLCSQDHLNLIVNAHPDPKLRTAESFQLLLGENLRSLSERYPHRIDEHADFAKDHVFEAIEPWDLIKRVYESDPSKAQYYAAVGKPLNALRVAAQVRQSCDSYDYQSEETDDYYTTPAAAFVHEVRDAYADAGKAENEALWAF